MRWVPAASLLVLLAGCTAPSDATWKNKPGGGDAAGSRGGQTPETSLTTPTPPSTASAGKWQGEAGDLRLTLVLKPDSTLEWKEETAESSKTWTGKWRDEGGELYLLLDSPTKRNALFEKKGETWVEVTIDDQPALKDAEIVLKSIS